MLTVVLLQGCRADDSNRDHRWKNPPNLNIWLEFADISLFQWEKFSSRKKKLSELAAWWNFPGYQRLKISIWNVNERRIRWRSKTFSEIFQIYFPWFFFSQISSIHHSFINLSNVVSSHFFRLSYRISFPQNFSFFSLDFHYFLQLTTFW